MSKAQCVKAESELRIETSFVDPPWRSASSADSIDVRYSGSMAIIFYCMIQSWPLLFFNASVPELVTMSLPLGDGSAPII